MPTVTDCPLCPENGKVNIVMETLDAYLVLAKFSPIEGAYLIVPKEHITDVRALPAGWLISLQYLLGEVPWYNGDASFNLSLNSGEAAGQTLPHIHFWAIPRKEMDTAPSYGLGAATLIKTLNATAQAAT